jgi:hypothetical protein
MKTIKSRYEELILKSELATQTAQKSETSWACLFWSNVADKLKNMALSLPLDKAVGVF